MTQSIRQAARFLVRFVLLWLVDALSLLLTAAILPGMEFVASGATAAWVIAVSAALVMALVNLLIRPVILLLARPLGFFVMFGVGFVVNALILLITANLLAPAFQIGGLLQAIVASIVLSAINMVLTGIVELDDEGSFFQNRIERMAKRDTFRGAAEPGRGLVMVEIDGLSYHHIQKALAEGLMPTVQQMIDQEAADAVLSDDAIVTRLKDANIDIARRTVAKYRESLRIPSSVERRREKAALSAQPA